MALTHDITRVKKYEKLCYNKDDSLNPITHALITGSMATGIREITEKTVDQVAARFDALETVGVCFLYMRNGIERNPTLDEIKAHIGLVTNADAVTEAMFKRRLGEDVLRTSQRRVADQQADEVIADLKVAK